MHFSKTQFAKEAQVTVRTVTNWLIRNQIPGAHIMGGRWRIPKAAIEQMKHNPYVKGPGRKRG